MDIKLPDLPYKHNELEPYISKETIEYHYGKHHKGYVDKLNKLITGTSYQGLTLEEIILKSKDVIFNNAAQIWNHNFYWKCLTPNQTNPEPSGDFLQAIFSAFGDFANFKEKFKEACISKFGSGWVWLVKNERNDLEIISTGNANTPLSENKISILTCDVWEHAYYIDYRNDRAKYVDAFMKIINWDFATLNFHKNI